MDGERSLFEPTNDLDKDVDEEEAELNFPND